MYALGVWHNFQDNILLSQLVTKPLVPLINRQQQLLLTFKIINCYGRSWVCVPEMLSRHASVRIFQTVSRLAYLSRFSKKNFAHSCFCVIGHHVCIFTSRYFHASSSLRPLSSRACENDNKYSLSYRCYIYKAIDRQQTVRSVSSVSSVDQRTTEVTSAVSQRF